MMSATNLINDIEADHIAIAIMNWNRTASDCQQSSLKSVYHSNLSYVLKSYDSATHTLSGAVQFKGVVYSTSLDDWKSEFGQLLSIVHSAIIKSFNIVSSNDPDRILIRLKLLLDRIDDSLETEFGGMRDIRPLCLEYIRICILYVSNGWGLTSNIVNTLNNINQYSELVQQLIIETND